MAILSLSADEFTCQPVANEIIYAADIDVAGMICRVTKLRFVRLSRVCRAGSTHHRSAASSDGNDAPIRIGPFGLAPAERRQLISAGPDLALNVAAPVRGSLPKQRRFAVSIPASWTFWSRCVEAGCPGSGQIEVAKPAVDRWRALTAAGWVRQEPVSVG